jgi:carbonic anhydrase/acetyltransferase-like protein (isoleucine patch superfamily)
MPVKIGEKCYIAESAVLIGDVTIDDEVCIMDGAVLRGDLNSIKIGKGSNIQDNVTLHTEKNHATILGEKVSVGHNAVVHGCTVESEVLVGMGSILMNGSRISRGSVVAAGSVVRENFTCPEKSLVAGAPATLKRSGDDSLLSYCIANAESYSILREDYILGRYEKVYGRDIH